MEVADNPNVSRTWATLRIWGAQLDPKVVTERLGLVPSCAHRRGEQRSNGHTWRHGAWHRTSEGQLATTDLEEHIAWVIGPIEPMRDEFAALLVEGVKADVFCFLEGVGHGGPEFSPSLLGRLATLHLVLGLDIHFAD